MELFHVQYDCGDYYCDSTHTVGVFSTNANAVAAIPAFKIKIRAETGVSMEHLDSYDYKITTRTLDAVESYGE